MSELITHDFDPETGDCQNAFCLCNRETGKNTPCSGGELRIAADGGEIEVPS